jgi:HAD superfamily hydrolase (TIGR01509 family)
VARVGIGFDIDHTLAIDNKLERVAFLHLLDRIAAEGGHALGTLTKETQLIDELLAFQRAGGCSIEDAVRNFVRDRGGKPHEDYVEGFKRLSLTMAETFIIPDPDAKGTIDELTRRGVAIGVLSNGWNPLQSVKARRAGFTGPILASGDIGVQKPNPEAFGALAAELGLAPEQCYYVGDDPKNDIMGAMSAGFRTVWLDNEGKSYPADLPPPHHVVHSLRGVLGLVASKVSS